MLNKKTTNFIWNKLSNSLIKYNINNNKNSNYNNELLLKLENENTASKNLYKKRGIDLNTRNALSVINDSKYSLKKTDLIKLTLIGQFDKKFCIFYRENDKSIIFFDQHAVHERILYEYYQELLLNEFYSNNNAKSKANDIKLNLFNDIFGKYELKNSKFIIKAKENNININYFNNCFLYNKNCHIQTLFNFTWLYSYKNDIIIFYTVPIIFDKIHKIEVLVEIFAFIINNIETYWKSFINKKRNILEPFDLVIKSKACRNAVKFNDELDRNFIKNMIYELSLCNNPFLCAHGRHNYFIKHKKNAK
jgi:DNA mismatch repair protein MLH3